MVREEKGGKLSIFGMFGFAPDVRIVVNDFPASFPLTFLIQFEKVEKDHELTFNAGIAASDQDAVSVWPDVQFKIEQGKTALMALTVNNIKLEKAGKHKFSLEAEGEEVFSTEFEVAKGYVE